MTSRALLLGLFLLAACNAEDERNGGDPSLDPGTGTACLLSGVTAQIAVQPVDKLDLVFVVDNSATMAEEQASLREQLPRMLRMLTAGDANDDGAPDFPPVRDLQLGVVSSDLGLVGSSEVPSCMGLGDDGLLNGAASPDVEGCSTTRFEPAFLSYSAEDDELEGVATDLGCLTTIGTEGCGIEQPLESMIKAVWPAENMDVWFLSDSSGFGMSGQGGLSGPNGPLVRSSADQPASLVAFVVVTDEEDCSMSSTEHFAALDGLPADDPLRAQGLDTRCFFEAQLDRDPNQPGLQNNLYGPRRYVEVLRALRPGQPQLVMFAAIVGVPPELVERDDLAAVDFTSAAQVDAFYDGILSDARMIETLDDQGTIDVADDDLVPSCDRGENQRAYPPRRILEVARGFGANGLVQSICQDDFEPAIDSIVFMIGRQLLPVCLPRPILRENDGSIECEMIWELPAPSDAPDGAPVACDDHPLLREVETEGDRGGAGERCTLPQLAIQQSGAEPDGDGWYYDDFSAETELCAGSQRQRISFSEDAKPPAGVEVYLRCLNETFPVPPAGEDATDRYQPRLGDSCDPAQAHSCGVQLKDGTTDDAMFCHPQLGFCELPCDSAGDCPDAWLCEESDAARELTDGRGLCRTPACRPGPEVSAAGSVGDPCFTEHVPATGFDDSEVYVEPESEHCAGAACIVYHLGGDPREGCLESSFGCVPDQDNECSEQVRCASARDIVERVYCSCRCDAPEGLATCDCPDGFSCAPAITHGPEGAQGSYCVRNGTFAD